MPSVRTFRIVPFQIGFPFREANSHILIEYLTKINGWKLRNYNNSNKFDPFKNGFFIFKIVRKIIYTLDFTADGVGILTIIEPPVFYENIEDVDPESLNFIKGRRNSEILNDDMIVNEISKIIQYAELNCNSFGYTDFNSASKPDYVFSVFVVTADSRILVTDKMKHIISVLINPRRTKSMQNHPLFEMSDSRLISKKMDERVFSDCIIEDLPFRKSYFSWASAVFVGEKDNYGSAEFVSMQKEIQAMWVYAFFLEKNLDYIVNNLEKNLDDDSVFCIISRTSHLYSISRQFSTIHSGRHRSHQIEAGAKILRNSRLDIMLSNIREKSSAIKDAIIVMQEIKSRTSQKFIEMLIFVLVSIQALSSYLYISESSKSFTFEIALVCATLVAAALMAIYLRKR